MRLFIGIDLPVDIKIKLSNFQQELKTTGTSGSWKSKETFHITLEFLGELPEESIPVLSGILDLVVSERKPFRLMLEGLNTFPSSKRPHTLWAAVKGETEPLFKIQKEIHAAIFDHGFRVQTSPFVPHITILSRPRLSDQIPTLMKSAEFTVREIILFESKVVDRKRVYPSIYKSCLNG